MQWWCSAQGIPWSWEWRPYIGVWLFVGGVAVAYWRTYRATSASVAVADDPLDRWRRLAALGGIVCMWLLLDWPIGTLGAGYLASVHMVQFLGLALVVPPLLLFGLPTGCEESLSPRVAHVLARVTRPLTALIGFNLIVFVTHFPAFVDGLMVTQAGSFVFDVAWLAGGLAFWWPVVRRWPKPGLGPAVSLVYVLGGMGAHMGLGMFFAIAPTPVYRVYELAPPIGTWDALGDQQRAGGLMLFGDVVIGLVAVGILVYRWQREEHERLADGEFLKPVR